MKLHTLLILFIIGNNINTLLAQINNEQINIENADSKLKIINSDSLLLEYKNTKLKNLAKGDTLSAIGSIIEISNIHSTTGNYSHAYDGYWDALIYSNTISDSTHVAKIYRKLGMLYSIFRRSEKAERYFDLSLKVAKSHTLAPKKKYATLNDTYYIIACHNREQGNYGLAEKYLDSCYIMSSKISKETKFPFLDAEHGYLNFYNGRYDKALDLLLPNQNYFSAKNPEYLVIFYSFLGDIYLKKNDYNTSETYYLKSLDISKKHKSHSNYIPDVYQKLADLYFKINKKDLAYKNLQLSKNLSEELFGVRSRNNSDILEIKDTYRIESENQMKLLGITRLNKLEQQQKTLFFKNVALTISILSLCLISGIIVWYLHKRRTYEKINFLSKQKLSKEKNSEILALKNRELTSSALQLIQKDALIKEIKDTLTTASGRNEKEIKQVLTKIKINKNLDWKEFNARFTSVNKIFYKTLSNTFPKLTRRDLRLCALIKLNFSSKEIALLLGISPESVNTSRYRLRKKMNLKKDEDLHKFIAEL